MGKMYQHFTCLFLLSMLVSQPDQTDQKSSVKEKRCYMKRAQQDYKKYESWKLLIAHE